MDYRVEQLAAAGDVSVDTVRYYQARGLLPPPRRRGRVALYGDEHLERLARIRRLQGRGLTLAVIRRLLDGELDGADEALVTALAAAPVTPVASSAGPAGGGDGEDGLTLDDVARRSGIPLALLQAVERDGLLTPGARGYTAADVHVARAGLALLENGLPLGALLDLARRHHAAMQEVAEQAVELFDDHVRHPLRQAGLPEDESAARLVDAFNRLLPATATLVAHHFTRTLLAAAQRHIERVGADAELAAVREAAR